MSDQNGVDLFFFLSSVLLCVLLAKSFLVPSSIAWSIFNCRPDSMIIMMGLSRERRSLGCLFVPVVFSLPIILHLPLRLTYFKEYSQFSTSASYLAEMEEQPRITKSRTQTNIEPKATFFFFRSFPGRHDLFGSVHLLDLFPVYCRRGPFRQRSSVVEIERERERKRRRRCGTRTSVAWRSPHRHRHHPSFPPRGFSVPPRTDPSHLCPSLHRMPILVSTDLLFTTGQVGS
jgi:hypothetical protein